MEQGAGGGERHRSICRACLKHRPLCLFAALVLTCDTTVCAVLAEGQPIFIFLLALRTLVLGGGFVLAVKLGTGAWKCRQCPWQGRRPARAEGSQVGEELGQVGNVQPLSMPLTSLDSWSPTRSLSSWDASHATGAGATSPPTSPAVARNSRLDEDLAQRREAFRVKEENSVKRNVVLGLCFLVVTVQSTFAAVKILTIWEIGPLTASCLTATIFCMNVEFLVLKRLVDWMTREEGIHLPAIHEHLLYYSQVVGFSVCKICRERIGPRTGGSEGFKCMDCDAGSRMGFWVCMVCYRKQQAKTNTQEGILRGDKGPKFTAELTASQYFFRAIRLTRPFRCTLWLAVSGVVLRQGAQIFMPRYQGFVINSIIHEDMGLFQRDLFTFILLSVTSLSFGSVQSLTVEIVQRRIMIDMRTALFKNLIRQDIAFFDGVMTGQLTSRMTNDIAAVVQPVKQLLNTVLSNLLSLFGGLVMCFFTSWRLTVLASTLIGPVIFLTGIYAKWSKEINVKIRVHMADANAIATEALRNIRTVRSYGADDVELNEFQSHMDDALRSGMKDAYGSAGVSVATQYVDFAATILILWYGGVSVIRHDHGLPKLSVGELITFNLYWNMLKNAINGLNGMLNSLVRAASAAQRVFEVLDLEPDIPLDGGDAALDLDQVFEVEFRDVRFKYQMRPETEVLVGLSFTMPPGGTVAVVGRSGAGKSTLVSLLLRFYDPQGGAVLLNGRPLPEYNLRTYQKRVGVVSQETQVFCRPISENIAYGLPRGEVTEDRVVEAARMAHAHDFITELDEGYKSMIGEGGARLSGGQKQRLAIARALLRRPSLLLLDEATSALDAENEGKVQESIDSLVGIMAGQCSILLIAHRLSTVMGADRIIVVDGGRVAEQGRHDELLRSDGIYASLVKRQLAKYENTLSEEPMDSHHTSGAEAGEGEAGHRGKGKGKWKRLMKSAPT